MSESYNIPEKMWAAVVERPGRLVIEQIDTPVPGPGQYLIQTLASSICNATDNHILEGIFEGYHDHYDRQLGNGAVGQVLGHEVCGRVVKLGEGCTDVRLGDRVGMYTNHGAFQEYVLVDAHWGCTARVPEALSDEEASICEMFDGAYRSTISCANLQPHEKVLIVGVGPMGLTATAAAVAHYADVYVVDFHQNRLDKALELGAKAAFNHTGKNRHQMVEEILAAAGMMDMACICIALDESEEQDAFYLALETLRENGRMTGLNVEVKEEHHNHVMNPFHMNRKNILYRHNLTRPGTQRDFQHGYDMVAEGRVPLGKLITHRATLDQLPWALEMCHRHLDECIKFIIYPENKTGERLVYELPENY